MWGPNTMNPNGSTFPKVTPVLCGNANPDGDMGAATRLSLPSPAQAPEWPGHGCPSLVRFCALFWQEAMKLPRSTPEEKDRWGHRGLRGAGDLKASHFQLIYPLSMCW